METRNVKITLETAKRWHEQGGEFKEMALSAFTESELNPVRNEWKSKIFGKKSDGYYIFNSKIKRVEMPNTFPVKSGDMDIFKTEKQAKSALAYAQLTQLMALPEYNGDWVPTWNNGSEWKYSIVRSGSGIYIGSCGQNYKPIAFESSIKRDKFLENNLDLLKEYFELD